MKVAYILSYKYPDYVRTRYLLKLLDAIPNTRVHKAINSKRGVVRYFQTMAKLLAIRFRHKPDVYILGFRGAETYWLVRLITAGKPLIYDEFLNPYLWTIEEHGKFGPKNPVSWPVWLYVGFTLRTADAVLSDTELHARYSYENFKIDPGKFTTLYVGTDEELFQVATEKKVSKKGESFNVFFYGNFLPLHGIEIIVEAAERLANFPIKFTIIGGANRKSDMKRFLNVIKSKGLTNVVHLAWVAMEELPKYIDQADLCLGGPFGNTPQAKLVITGKTYQFLAMGKATIVGQVNEHVGFKDKENCLIVRQGSAEALADAIRWAQAHTKELEAIGTRGKELYLAVFSQEAQVDKLNLVLEKLTKN
jgi:glycosyltransferase involved in cell wall biosynthesis